MKDKNNSIHNLNYDIQKIWDTIDCFPAEESEMLHLIRANFSYHDISEIIERPEWYVRELIAHSVSNLYEKLFNEKINDLEPFLSYLNKHEYSKTLHKSNIKTSNNLKQLIDLMICIQTLTERPLPTGIIIPPLESLTKVETSTGKLSRKFFIKKNMSIYASSTVAALLAIMIWGQNHQSFNKTKQNVESPLPIFTALQKNDIDQVKSLLQKKANVNAINRDGYTPLYIACSKGYTEIVKLLLQANADVTLQNYSTPLKIATYEGHKEIVKLLIDAGVNVNQVFSDIEASVNIVSAKKHNNVTQMNSYINTTNPALYSPLYIASMKGYGDVVKLLLQSNAKVDIPVKFREPLFPNEFYFITPLFTASKEGNKEIVKLLIDAKANVNTVSRFGYTPLHIATSNGYTEIVELLLKANANVESSTVTGYTPLFIASKKGYMDIVKLLLEANACVNSQNKNGHSPLYIASKNGRTDIVKLLLQFNANANTLPTDLFTEDFESYPVSINIHYYQNPTIWQTVGNHTQSVFILGNAYNKYAVINFNSTHHAWLSFGFVQKIDYYWNPPEDLTEAIISFDIATSLDKPILDVLTPAFMTADGQVYRLPDFKLRNLPSENDGWVTMSFNITDFTLNNQLGGYDPPFDPSQIVSLQILVVQNVNRFIAKGRVYLDNIVIKEISKDN